MDEHHNKCPQKEKKGHAPIANSDSEVAVARRLSNALCLIMLGEYLCIHAVKK